MKQVARGQTTIALTQDQAASLQRATGATITTLVVDATRLTDQTGLYTFDWHGDVRS